MSPVRSRPPWQPITIGPEVSPIVRSTWAMFATATSSMRQ